MPAMTASATSFIPSRRSMAVFWIHRKASASVSLSFFMRTPLARSTAFRVSKASPRAATSFSSSFSSHPPPSPILTARVRAAGGHGLQEAGVARAPGRVLEIRVCLGVRQARAVAWIGPHGFCSARVDPIACWHRSLNRRRYHHLLAKRYRAWLAISHSIQSRQYDQC